MKRIGLIDVDGHNFPNIALMKILKRFEDYENLTDEQREYVRKISAADSMQNAIQ